MHCILNPQTSMRPIQQFNCSGTSWVTSLRLLVETTFVVLPAKETPTGEDEVSCDVLDVYDEVRICDPQTM